MGPKYIFVLCLIALTIEHSTSIFFPKNLLQNFNIFSNHRVRCYKLVVEHGIRSPDGFPQDVILINGSFPGPELITFQREDLIVQVENKLDHGMTMHFHGIESFGTIDSDGAPIVQNLIMPNCTYNYHLRIREQVGTFMYHSHVHFDRVWAHGALIIKDSPLIWASYPSSYFYNYNKDKVIFLEQILHTSLKRFEDSLIKGPFEGFPTFESLLINGKSYGVWNDSQLTSSSLINDTEGYEVISVQPGYTYRLRVISMAIENMLWFKIYNHTMKIVEMDGVLCNPVVTDHLEINSGQRYSVLVRMNSPIDNYIIETRLIGNFNSPKNGIAILHYKGASDPQPLRKIPRPGKFDTILEPTKWTSEKLYPNKKIIQRQVYPLPKIVHRNILISSQVTFLPGGKPRFDMNGNILNVETTSNDTLLQKVRRGINIKKEPEVFEITTGEAVQVVFQSRVGTGGLCLQHPWHFHGYHIYVVGDGPDLYEPEKADPLIDKNIREGELEFRDVVTHFTGQTIKNTTEGAPCGWLAVRFFAYNPGLWLAHCHLTAHSLVGKRFVFWEHYKSNPRLIGL